MTRHDRQTRWCVACHEGGHVLVGLLYDPHAVRSASLTPDGTRGLALQPASLTDRQAAIFAAAGKAGESFADHWPPPKMKRQKPTEPQTVETIRQKAVAETFTDHAVGFFNQRGVVTDDEIVGVFAVRLHPSDPGEWEGDVRRVNEDAARLVRRHRGLLRAIATQLFREGFYFVPSSDGAKPNNASTEDQK